ncbi:hypothetical protein PIB30_116136, partial [Stylosanthes scabra]|nr:hypothetical protein [Stylosanthes scabra]
MQSKKRSVGGNMRRNAKEKSKNGSKPGGVGVGPKNRTGPNNGSGPKNGGGSNGPNNGLQEDAAAEGPG